MLLCFYWSRGQPYNLQTLSHMLGFPPLPKAMETEGFGLVFHTRSTADEALGVGHL